MYGFTAGEDANLGLSGSPAQAGSTYRFEHNVVDGGTALIGIFGHDDVRIRGNILLGGAGSVLYEMRSSEDRQPRRPQPAKGRRRGLRRSGPAHDYRYKSGSAAFGMMPDGSNAGLINEATRPSACCPPTVRANECAVGQPVGRRERPVNQ